MGSYRLDKFSFFVGMGITGALVWIVNTFAISGQDESALLHEPANAVVVSCADSEQYTEQQSGYEYTQALAQTSSLDSASDSARSVAAIIESGLTEAEIRRYDEYPVERIKSELSDDPELVVNTIEKIRELDWSSSRSYLIALLGGLETTQKEQAAFDLLQSPRDIDQKAGVSLIMDLDDSDIKASAVGAIISANPSEEVVQNLLEHIRVDDDLAVSPSVNASLQQLYQSHPDAHVQRLALQAITPSSRIDDNLYQDVVSLITQDYAVDTYASLDTLNTWVVNNDNVLSDAQKIDLANRAMQVADSSGYDIDARIKALELLKNIQ
jgi:hypothetical protein